jgi:hypothetical protein
LLLLGASNDIPLFLRIRSPARGDRADFMFQVEYQPGGPRSSQQLERLEWRARHTNPNYGPVDLRLRDFECTHIHSFELNYLAKEKRMRSGNLELARPVEPEPENFEDFLALAEKLLRIKGLAELRLPWAQGAFRGFDQ